MTHLELRPSECTDSVLSVSLVFPFSSLVLNESEEPLWYFLVSILDKACSAILVREDCVSDRKKKQILDERRDLDYLISMAEQGRSIEVWKDMVIVLCGYVITNCLFSAPI